MAGNPRIDELRKKVEKDPGSRLFAQLAEELRKDGALDDAIRVAREGLQKHPNYPSARMTLGRGLADSRDFAAARLEFEQVLKGAPDNILASRFLAECLESLGDIPGAITRYKATLVLAPGDKQIMARLEALAGGRAPAAPSPGPAAPPGAGTAAPRVGVAPPSVAPPSVAPAPVVESAPTVPPQAPAAGVPPPELPPIPLVAADEEFEIDRPYEAPTPPAASAAPAAPAPPVEFELESPHEAPSAQWSAPPAAFATPPVPIPAAPAPVPSDFDIVEDQEFETSPASTGNRAAAAPTFRNDLLAEAARQEIVARSPAPSEAEPSSDAAGPPHAVASPTLAELYVDQGFVDKAVEVYQEIVQRDPANQKAAQRLAELRETEATGDPVAERRKQVEQTIARLEGFLAAVKRG